MRAALLFLIGTTFLVLMVAALSAVAGVLFGVVALWQNHLKIAALIAIGIVYFAVLRNA